MLRLPPLNILDYQTKKLLAQDNLRSIIIRFSQRYTKEFFAEITQSTNRRAQSVLSGKRPINLDEFLILGPKMGISFDSLANVHFDIDCAFQHLSGELDYLPTQYRNAAFSKVHTSNSIIETIRNIYGPEAAENAMTSCQMGRQHFSCANANENVGTTLNSDLYKHLAEKKRLTSINIYMLGQQSYRYYRNTPFGQKFNGLRKKEATEFLVASINDHLEKSYQYELTSLNSDHAILRKYFKKESQDLLNRKQYGSSEGCIFSAGVFSSLPLLSQEQNSPMRVNINKSMFNGDNYTEMEATF